MIKIKLMSRKPTVWAVACGDRRGVVGQSPPGVARCRRWYLLVGEHATFRFSSRRAAFGFFENGRKVVAKPVYVGGGRAGQRRIR